MNSPQLYGWHRNTTWKIIQRAASLEELLAQVVLSNITSKKGLILKPCLRPYHEKINSTCSMVWQNHSCFTFSIMIFGILLNSVLELLSIE